MYAIFEDLVRAYVGPFNSQAEVDEHVKFCQARGDGAAYLGTVDQPPAGEFVLTPAEDRAYDPNA